MILNFLNRARRRFLWNEVIAQCAFAAALLMGGIVLLLVIGTQILDWRWIVALSLAAFGVALYRTLKRVPSAYKIAMFVDQRAGLHDALSTAHFFSDPANGTKTSASVQAAQRSYAEGLIPSVDLERAVPFHMPRAIYAMGILGLVASSLFALRYGTSKQLDWRPPISQLIIESLGLKDPEAKQTAKNKKQEFGKPADALDGEGNPLPKSELQKKQDQAQSPTALDSAGEPDPNTQSETSAAKGGNSKSESNDKTGAEQGENEKAQGGSPQSDKNSADNPSGSQDGQQKGEPQSGGKEQQAGNNSSLMSKMKEAMSNLLSKAKSPSSQQAAGDKKNSQGKGDQKAQAQQQQNGEKGSQSQDQKGDSQDSADSQQGQQAGDSEKSQDSQGKGSGKNSDQQASAQPGSGIGKQDGAKDVHAAEQKAAMGKLSEIIGKRSANVSGEMMLDVQSGPQQLKTNYSKSSATHAASGGEISRDEVPVALQSYVQQYFEEVRKSEHAAPAKAKPSPEAK